MTAQSYPKGAARDGKSDLLKNNAPEAHGPPARIFSKRQSYLAAVDIE